MTVDEYAALTEAGILDKVELINGVVVMGRFPLAFSPEQVEAASALGIDLPEATHSSRRDPPGATSTPGGCAAAST